MNSKNINQRLNELFIKHESGEIDYETYLQSRSCLIDSFVLEINLDSISDRIQSKSQLKKEQSSLYSIAFILILIVIAGSVLVDHLSSIDLELLSGKSVIPAQATNE